MWQASMLFSDRLRQSQWDLTLPFSLQILSMGDFGQPIFHLTVQRQRRAGVTSLLSQHTQIRQHLTLPGLLPRSAIR